MSGAVAADRQPLMRRDADGDHTAPVGTIELFFDLVFVFAITQLAHYLVEHHTLAGMVQATILFLAVWWAWIYTTWAINFLNADAVPVRLMLFAVMLAALVMAVVLPEAFDQSGMRFAVTYVAVQVGRTAMLWAMMRRAGDTEHARLIGPAVVWFIATTPLWIAGGWTEDAGQRALFWGIALVVELAGPLLNYWLPFGPPRPRTNRWRVSGAHMAERCGLFIIIALGEGIIITGRTFASLDQTPADIATFVSAFVTSVLLWWIYFDIGASRGAHHIEQHDDPGRIARDIYTYWHIPIVAGIVAIAVADEMALAHPLDPAKPPFIWAMFGGSLIFLIGNAVFKRITSPRGNLPLSHLVGITALALGMATAFIQPASHMVWSLVSTAILFIVAVWEWVSFHGGWRKDAEPLTGANEAGIDVATTPRSVGASAEQDAR